MLAVHSSSIVKIVKVNQITPKPGTFLVSRLDLLQSLSTEQNHLKITAEQVAPILRVSQVLLLLKAQNLAMVNKALRDLAYPVPSYPVLFWPPQYFIRIQLFWSPGYLSDTPGAFLSKELFFCYFLYLKQSSQQSHCSTLLPPSSGLEQIV